MEELIGKWEPEYPMEEADKYIIDVWIRQVTSVEGQLRSGDEQGEEAIASRLTAKISGKWTGGSGSQGNLMDNDASVRD